MLLSDCCNAHIIDDTESDTNGICSKCLEFSTMWDDTYESTSNDTCAKPAI